MHNLDYLLWNAGLIVVDVLIRGNACTLLHCIYEEQLNRQELRRKLKEEGKKNNMVFGREDILI